MRIRKGSEERDRQFFLPNDPDKLIITVIFSLSSEAKLENFENIRCFARA